MALSGIKVLEIAGLAPAPYAGKTSLLLLPSSSSLFQLSQPRIASDWIAAGMILSDFGASVVRIDRTDAMNTDNLSR